MEREHWKPIPDFPSYSVSDQGRVRNNYTDRIMALTRNQQQIMQVGLNHNGKHYKRSVTVLVANAFLPRAEEPFDTPINLDGDRSNNAVTNLMWRPRWYAYMYHRQFKEFQPHHIKADLMDMDTREISHGSRACAIQYGLLEMDLVLAVLNRTFVWPTYQIFKVVS